MRIGWLALAMAGCGSEYTLQPVSTAADPGAALEAWEDPGAGVRQEAFAFGGGATTPVADYLFVVDNSSSMHNVIDRVRAGFAALSGEQAFPPKARIAVMGTLPARLEGSRRLPHPAVRFTPAVPRDPGFLHLVDGARIAAFRPSVTGEVADRFGHDGCDEGWFAPGARNAEGVPCLVAHTQIAMTYVGIEAGLVALKQMLLEHRRGGLFRPGAAANVIFVSDTHDPGKSPVGSRSVQALVDYRPDLAELQALAASAQPLASFQVHAVAPRSECSERWADIGPVYFQVAEASGGQTLDVCTATDYSGLIRQVAREGAVVRRGVFPLGRPARTVDWVELDGTSVPYRIDRTQRVITVDDPVPDHRAEVMVHYRPRALPNGPAGTPERSTRGTTRHGADATRAPVGNGAGPGVGPGLD